MSGAIAKALPTCRCRTLRRVGFAQNRKLLRIFTKFAVRLVGSVGGQMVVTSEVVELGNDCVSVIIQRHNSTTMRP